MRDVASLGADPADPTSATAPAAAPSRRPVPPVALALLLVVAAALRLHGLRWDDGAHLHPDERFLTMVTAALRAPDSLAAYFDTARSPLNPSSHGFHFFVYGTLPLFVTRAVAAALGLATYEHVVLVGRALSALWDVGTVWLTVRIGVLIAGPALGLAAGALVALCVLAIQQSHFYTVDAAGTFFATATLLAILHAARDPRWLRHVAVGTCLGLTLGCRINLAPLAAPYALALLVAWRGGRGRLPSLVAGGVVAAALAALVFRIVQPYAFAGPGFFDVGFAHDFVTSLREIREAVAGRSDMPPSVQWIGRTPFFFAARNVLGWNLGPAWGAAVPLGVAWLLWRGARRGVDAAPGAIVALWTAALFTYLALQFAPTGRYFAPLVPGMALVAAAPLLATRRRRVALVAILALTALWAVAFTAIYRRPHTRIAASRWIYATIPDGATIASEHWDDALPLPLPGAAPTRYRSVQLELFANEDPAMRRTLLDRLGEADWIVISSNRLYRTVPRAPWRYPLARRYYELLFSGALGFDLERVFTSYPRLGPLEIPDDDAEEAFTVYDHPTVLAFRKTERFTPQAAGRLLGAVPLRDVELLTPLQSHERYRHVRPADLPMPNAAAVRTPVAARERGSVASLSAWIAVTMISWVGCFTIVARTLASLPDAGAGIAATLAWLAPAWLAWLLTSLGAPVVTTGAARLTLAAVAVAGTVAAGLDVRGFVEQLRARRRAIGAALLVYWVTFAGFLAVRALVPAVYWGEKPMDFAILNTLLRARTLPPPDPWFAGETLNYAYFGHACVAFFARAAGVAPAYAFNLAIASVAAGCAVAAFTAGRYLGGSMRVATMSAVAVVGLGNLAGPVLLATRPGHALDFDYFWATSRVIDHTINEFPLWNLLFADLHGHVLAQPLLLGLIAVGGAALLTRDAVPLATLGVVAAGLAGAIATTSPWSTPTAAAVLGIFLAVTAWARRAEPLRSTAVLGSAPILAAVAAIAFWPFWQSYRGPDRAWGWETQRAPLGGVLTIFGVFLVAAVPPLVATAFRRGGRRRAGVGALAGVAVAAGVAALRSATAGAFAGIVLAGVAGSSAAREPGVKASGLLVALVGAIGLATETVYVWDRMNTIFKYYLDAWLLLGCAAAVLAGVAAPALGRWRTAWFAAVTVAVAGGAITAATDLFAFVRSPHAASDVPSLDGMAYLRRDGAGELEAYRWLAREVPGVPVVLEAQGPSYQAFGRVSMNTGLPTVLGWEYHLVQQGRSRDAIERRRADVREAYETPDRARAAALLARYHVDLVFVGPLERATYARAGLLKFRDWDAFPVVFRNREVTVYGTPGLLAHVKTWVDRVTDAAPIPPLGRLREPRDLASAPDGTVVVADFGNSRLQRFGRDGGVGAAIGGKGAAPGELREPCGVAVGPDGRLYVADTWNHRVQVLSPAGEPLEEWRADFYGPRGIAVTRDGGAYVTDTGNRRVVLFDRDGAVRTAFGRPDLEAPIGVALDRRGEVYVADAAKRRIVVFSAAGERLRDWAVPWREGARMEPYLELGPDDVVWVTDPIGDRVLLFDGAGRELGAARPERPLHLPLGIAVLDTRTAVVTSAADDAVVVVHRD